MPIVTGPMRNASAVACGLFCSVSLLVACAPMNNGDRVGSQTAQSSTTDTPPSAPPSIPGIAGQRGCVPDSPRAGNEARGTSDDQSSEAFGEFQSPDSSELRAADATQKFVVRMTGSGELKATLESPDGSTRALDWGPELHVGSNYARPGDEWGMGLRIDAPGCWGLLLTRSQEGSVSFWFEVH
jgi:hypothetical protein